MSAPKPARPRRWLWHQTRKAKVSDIVCLYCFAALAAAGCSTTRDSSVDALDSRLAWPCDRLVLEWAVVPERLQAMLGEGLKIRQSDGTGRVQLHVLRCAPEPSEGADPPSLAYAYSAVPVLGDSTPIVLTRIPPEGWFVLQRAAANGPAQALLESLGYPVDEAQLDFRIAKENGEVVVSIELEFANGRLAIKAKPTGHPFARKTRVAYLGGGDGYISAYFGKEASQRLDASAAVRFEGQTVLSEFELSGAPTAATLDRELTADRVFWRMPASG